MVLKKRNSKFIKSLASEEDWMTVQVMAKLYKEKKKKC